MRTKNFVINIYAAVTIAQGERKGRGRIIANYLANFLQALLAKGLPATAPLSELVGLHPISQDSASELLASLLFTDQSAQPAEETFLPNFIPQLHPDNCNLVAVESVTPEPYTSDPTTADEEDLNIEPLGPDAEPQVHRTPSAEELGHDKQPTATGPMTLEDWERWQAAQIPDLQPTVEAPPVPPASELLLQAAQLLVQMAQLHVEHERKIAQTSTTVGQMVAIGQQAAMGTLGLTPGDEPIPEQTMRSRIREIVNERQRITGEDYDQVYAFIYNRLYYLYGINVNARQKREGETYLALCERIGALGKVYAIVTSSEFQAAIKNAPVQPKAAA